MHTFVKLDNIVISFNCKKLGGLEIISYHEYIQKIGAAKIKSYPKILSINKMITRVMNRQIKRFFPVEKQQIYKNIEIIKGFATQKN